MRLDICRIFFCIGDMCVRFIFLIFWRSWGVMWFLSCEKGMCLLLVVMVGIWIEVILVVVVVDVVCKGENVENEILVWLICVVKEESSIFCWVVWWSVRLRRVGSVFCEIWVVGKNICCWEVYNEKWLLGRWFCGGWYVWKKGSIVNNGRCKCSEGWCCKRLCLNVMV